MNVAMYLRKSRAEENQSTDDVLRKHKEELTELANKNGYKVKKVYKEVVSGDALYTRPQMLQFLNDCEDGRYEAVLCTEISRLGRGGMSEQGIILDALKNAKVKIITLNKTYDLNDEFDEDITEMETFIARRELKMIKRRLQRGLDKSLQEGAYVANVPYGYKRAEINGRPSLAPDPAESGIVKTIYSLYVKDEWGCQRIAEYINLLGAKPRRGEKFSRNSVRFILRNEVYTGKIVWSKKSEIKKGALGNKKAVTVYHPKEQWKISNGLHEAIIDTKTWEAAQKKMNDKNYHKHYTGEIQNAFAGLIYCSKCGGHINRQLLTGEPPRLFCAKPGCCKSMQLQAFENLFFEALNNTLIYHETRADGRTKDIIDYSAIILNLQSQIKTAKKQQQNLYDLVEQGAYDLVLFKERNDVLDERISELQSELKATERKQEDSKPVNPEEEISRIRDFVTLYRSFTPSEANKRLKSIIYRVDYSYPQKGTPSLEITLKNL